MEPIIPGYRSWDLVWKGDIFGIMSPRLSSIIKEDIWEEDMEAKCPTNQLREHLVRGEGECGLYSLKSLLDISLRPSLSMDRIFGRILNYGVVLEASKGYRASNAIVDTIFAYRGICQWPAHLHRGPTVIHPAVYITPKGVPGVNIPELGTDGDIMAHCEEHYREAGRRTVVIWIHEVYLSLAQRYHAALVPHPYVAPWQYLRI